MNTNILNRVNVLVKKTYYTYERFEVDATFALLYHSKPLDVIELSQFIRVSDHLIQLDEQHYFIIFAFTDQTNAFKAAQNIVYSLDHHFNDHTSRIALDTFDPTKSPQMVLNRLKQILSEIHKNAYVRIDTENIFDS